MHMNQNALTLALAAALLTQAHAESVPGPSSDAAPVPVRQTKPRFSYPARPHLGGSSVLYDQSGVADAIVPAQDYQSTYDAFDSEAADDFVVTDPAGWTVSGVNFQVSYTTPPSGDNYDVSIYEDASGSPGTPSCEYASVSGVLDASETELSIALPAPCELAPGRYWVAFSSNLNFPPYAYWMAGQGAAVDDIANWRNAGDGDGTGCTDWSPMSSCVTPGSMTIGSGDSNLLFQIIGAVGASSGCGAGQLCLVTTVGTDMTPGACTAAQAVDATVGDQINFCYTVTNNTGIALDYHSLQNNVDGVLFAMTHDPLQDGETRQYNRIETVSQSATYTSTWTGQDVAPGYVAAIENGGGDCSDRIFADGFDDPETCPDEGFIGIATTGTSLGFDDEDTLDITMPFSFNFYGTTSNVISISNNGGILFASGWNLAFINESLPADVVGPPAIMPLWDDFAGTQGDVYYETHGSAPNRQFIVEWFNRAHMSGPANIDGATFELILGENGAIRFEYDDIAYSGFNNFEGDPDDCTGGLCATIGLQNDMSLYNQFSAFEASVADHSGILWTPAAPQIYTATDSVTVNVGAPQIVINPSPVVGSVPAGASTTIPFSVENHGDRDLDWTLAEAGPANLHFPPPGTRFSMPLGDPARVSAAPVPAALRHPNAGKPKDPSFHLPFGGVPTFAFDVYHSQFVTFDVLAPGTVEVVAPPGYRQWTGGAFVNGDFSKFYVLGGLAFIPPGGADMLAAIDTATGAETIIGPANSQSAGWNGMAYDSTSDKLYAVAGCGFNPHLATIDAQTGTATLVGTLPSDSCMIAIAIDAGGDMYGLDIATDALYAIDKTTGNDALIGSIGFNANYLQDMAFDQSTGILYLAGFDADAITDSIYTVDVTTGLASIVGPLGATLGEVDAMGIETIGGPCGQEQDLPWLSLSPLSGFTPPSGASAVTASIDGSGANAGDILSGTVCAHSNDPAEPNHVLATPITVDVN
jgi:hypothetical protein